MFHRNRLVGRQFYSRKSQQSFGKTFRRARFERLETRALLTSLSGDFNGDGFDDLAVGAPAERVGSINDAGAVHILYGSKIGNTATGNQLFHLDSPGINEVAATGDDFGAALAAGDFNGDGFADLAVGAPRNDAGSLIDAGSVNIIYGSAAGLTATNDQQFTQDSSGINSVAQANELFGFALASGDFNDDGIADLAIGTPKELVGSNDFGGVHILFGSAAGLSNSGDQLFTQESSGIDGMGESNEQFGRALFAGDFNGDGRDDLAIGTPFADVATILAAGEVNVLYGSDTGLSNVGDQLFRLGIGGIQQPADNFNMRFGNALTAGDFNADGFDDLVVACPKPTGGDHGAVSVIYGSAAKLTATGNQLFLAPQVISSPNTNAQFGAAVIAADFDGDGDDDLAIGVPGLDIGAFDGAGAIVMLKGSVNGITLSGRQVIHQDSEDIPNQADEDDFFGNALTAGRYNGGARFDLAIGVLNEGDPNNAGTVHVLLGTTRGLSLSQNFQFTIGEDGILGNTGTANFGGALA